MEKQKVELARKNMYMSQDVARWYEEEAERVGVSQSALMTMVLSNYIDQRNSLDMVPALNKIVKFLGIFFHKFHYFIQCRKKIPKNSPKRQGCLWAVVVLPY